MYIYFILGSLIFLLLSIAMLHDGLAITGFEEVEKALLMKLGNIWYINIHFYMSYSDFNKLSFLYLGLGRRPVVNKNIKIPSATLDLYKSMLIENTITTNLPLPGLHTKSANTARTYSNKGK